MTLKTHLLRLIQRHYSLFSKATKKHITNKNNNTVRNMSNALHVLCEHVLVLMNTSANSTMICAFVHPTVDNTSFYLFPIVTAIAHNDEKVFLSNKHKYIGQILVPGICTLCVIMKFYNKPQKICEP